MHLKKRHLATLTAAALLLGACTTTAAPQYEQWTVTQSIPIVGLNDALGVYITGSLLSTRGHETVTYAYAYKTERGSVRQGTTSTLGLPYRRAEPLPVDVFEDAREGEARIDVLTCDVSDDAERSLGDGSLVCAERRRIEIHAPKGSVRLDMTVDGAAGTARTGEGD